MNKIRRVVSIVTASALTLSLYGCKKNTLEELKSQKEEFENIFAFLKEGEVLSSSDDTIESQVIYEESPEPSLEVEIIDASPSSSLEIPASAHDEQANQDFLSESADFVSHDNPFRFTYISAFDGNKPLYAPMGDYFTEKEANGVKCLINSSGKTILTGYDNLGNPFSWDFLSDDDIVYSRWIVPVYTGNTYSLYSFDDFEPIIKDCTLNYINETKTDYIHGSFNGYERSKLAYYTPIADFYFPAYDWFYDGPGEGNLTIIEKEGVLYLVDAYAFDTIYASGFIDVDSTMEDHKNVAVLTYPDGHTETYPSWLLKSYSSDVLTRKITRK